MLSEITCKKKNKLLYDIRIRKELEQLIIYNEKNVMEQRGIFIGYCCDPIHMIHHISSTTLNYGIPFDNNFFFRHKSPHQDVLIKQLLHHNVLYSRESLNQSFKDGTEIYAITRHTQLCDLKNTNDQSVLYYWNNFSSHFDHLPTDIIQTIQHTNGIRFILHFTKQYFTTWNILIPDHYAQNNDTIILTLIIEINNIFPLTNPCICVIYFLLEQSSSWYKQINSILSSLYNIQSILPLIGNEYPISLVSLSVPETISLCLKESWTPSISLVECIQRIEVFIRQQVQVHIVLLQDNPYITTIMTNQQHTRLDVYNTYTTISDINQQYPSPLLHQFSHDPIYLWCYILCIVCISISYRLIVSYLPHSGQFNSPIFGDYEAQRHWKELTFQQPLNSWYTHTTGYWDLDYPPLSAYHEYCLGWIINLFEPKSLLNSHITKGYYTLTHHLIMRLTVIVSDLVIFHTAAIFFWMKLPDYLLFPGIKCRKITTQHRRLLSLLIFLTCPPIVFIDHVHFQYNCIALGSILWSINLFALGRYHVGIIFVVAAILYKQTMLYYSPAIAFFILGITTQSIQQIGWLYRRFKPVPLLMICRRLIILIIISFLFAGIILTPFIIAGLPTTYIHSSPATWLHSLFNRLHLKPLIPIISRIFPFHRGIYEDYVSNFWVAISPIIKLNHIAKLSPHYHRMSIMTCTIITAMTVCPVCINLAKTPTFKKLLLTLFHSALCFYLFSAQVHEKAILLPLMIALLCLTQFYWFSIIFAMTAAFSLLHLMIKDICVPAYIGSVLLWSLLIYHTQWILKDDNYYQDKPSSVITNNHNQCSQKMMMMMIITRLLNIFKAICITLPYHILLLIYSSTERYTVLSFIRLRLLKIKRWSSYNATEVIHQHKWNIWNHSSIQMIIFTGFIFLMIAQCCIPPPLRYPYLHVYIHSLICCLLFILFALTAYLEQLFRPITTHIGQFPGMMITEWGFLEGLNVEDDSINHKKTQ